MVHHPTHTSGRSEQTQRRTTAGQRSRRLERDPLCPAQRDPVGDAPGRNGLWEWDDLLAASARLAAGRGMGEAPSGAAGTSIAIRADRLVAGQHRFRQCSGPRGGEQTGPNPTDRRKSGSKRHLVVERKGIPLAVRHTAANVCDITLLLEMVDAIPTLPGADGTLRNRPEKLHGDKGYDSNKHRRALEERGIIPRLGRRRIDDGSHLGKHRWVVERTLSWLNRFRRLRVRYERRGDIHQAFLTLGCALVCLRFVQRFC